MDLEVMRTEITARRWLKGISVGTKSVMDSSDMAGDFVPESELNLKGIHKYYNSYTLRGRFNWVITTYGVLFGLILLNHLRKKLTVSTPSAPQDPPESPRPLVTKREARDAPEQRRAATPQRECNHSRPCRG